MLVHESLFFPSPGAFSERRKAFVVNSLWNIRARPQLLPHDRLNECHLCVLCRLTACAVRLKEGLNDDLRCY